MVWYGMVIEYSEILIFMLLLHYISESEVLLTPLHLSDIYSYFAEIKLTYKKMIKK